MSVVLDVMSWAALLAGGFLVVTGGIGVIRFPDLYTRMHAASGFSAAMCEVTSREKTKPYFEVNTAFARRSQGQRCMPRAAR